MKEREREEGEGAGNEKERREVQTVYKGQWECRVAPESITIQSMQLHKGKGIER